MSRGRAQTPEGDREHSQLGTSTRSTAGPPRSSRRGSSDTRSFSNGMSIDPGSGHRHVAEMILHVPRQDVQVHVPAQKCAHDAGAERICSTWAGTSPTPQVFSATTTVRFECRSVANESRCGQRPNTATAGGSEPPKADHRSGKAQRFHEPKADPETVATEAPPEVTVSDRHPSPRDALSDTSRISGPRTRQYRRTLVVHSTLPSQV